MDPSTPGHVRVNPEVTIQPGGFFLGHYHPPRSSNLHDEVEIYRLLKGRLKVWLRPPSGDEWQSVCMCSRTPLLAIEPGWHHAGRVLGNESVVFVPYTRADHILTNDFGGNIQLLPDEDQPQSILHLIQAQRARDEQTSQS